MTNLDIFFDKDIKKYSKSYFDYLNKILNSIDLEDIKNYVTILLKARDDNSNIFFIGNGGSAATANHYANDLAIGLNISKPFKALSLCDNTAVITAIANDYGYEDVFVKQLKSLSKENDLVVAISASGNSLNLIKAIQYCNKNNINTVSIISFDGGAMKKISKNCIFTKTDLKEYGPAEDVHLIINHLIHSYLVRYLYERD